jgi:hypothetical protein
LPSGEHDTISRRRLGVVGCKWHDLQFLEVGCCRPLVLGSRHWGDWPSWADDYDGVVNIQNALHDSIKSQVKFYGHDRPHKSEYMGGPPTKGWTVTPLQLAYLMIAVSYVVAIIALAGGH